jgi:uncharacterized protein (DUF2062 family)
MGLQLFSNTFTFLFLWAITYKTGAAIASIFGADTAKTLQEIIGSGGFSWTLSNCGRMAMRWLATMLVGALSLGSLFGFISSAIYKIFAGGARRKSKIRNEKHP